MKKAATICIALIAMSAGAQTFVRPHIDKDGSYTEGHYRSNPNSTERDNYGTRGNYNPYTGDPGTRTPRQDPPSYLTPVPAPSYGQTCGYTTSGRYMCR